MTSHLVPPHGGQLVDLMASPARVGELNAHAKEMASWSLTPRQIADLELLLSGAFSPLRGFMGAAEAEGVRSNLRLGDGTFWPVPVTLEVTEEAAKGLGPGRALALRDGEGVLRAVLQVEEVWQGKDPATPVGTVKVAGLIEGVEAPHHYDFLELRKAPSRLREQFAEWGWSKVVAFHTGEVMHRAEHELTLAAARELEASLLVQFGVAIDSWWDAGYYSRVRCLQALVKAYPPGTAHLNLLPLAPRETGARDILLNAVVAQNYGCSHYLVRGPAASAGDELTVRASGSVRVHLVRIPERVYSPDKGAFVAEDAVPKAAAKTLPPAELAERLAWGRDIPTWFSFPEVLQELRRSRPPRSRQGFTVFFTGLPSSGKSTLGNVLLVKLLEFGGRPVTLLDGDIVRKHLSSELGFSREHRNLNIARIGFVASEITKNNGIAICAPIAPYDAVRKQVRAMIEPHGRLPPRARLDPDRGVRAARPQGTLRESSGGHREGVHRGLGPLRGAAGRWPRHRRLGAQPRGVRAGDPPAPREGGLHRAYERARVRGLMDPARLCTLLEEVGLLVRRAGEAIEAVRGGPLDTEEKADGSPVTRADRAAEAVLVEGLLPLLPGVAMVSEEGDVEAAMAGAGFTYWLVDPLDGTKEFLKGLPEYTVNVALVEVGVPILGAIHVPAADCLYLAARGQGARRLHATGRDAARRRARRASAPGGRVPLAPLARDGCAPRAPRRSPRRSRAAARSRCARSRKGRPTSTPASGHVPVGHGGRGRRSRARPAVTWSASTGGPCATTSPTASCAPASSCALPAVSGRPASAPSPPAAEPPEPTP